MHSISSSVFVVTIFQEASRKLLYAVLVSPIPAQGKLPGYTILATLSGVCNNCHVTV
jgi:hypothetical protein